MEKETKIRAQNTRFQRLFAVTVVVTLAIVGFLGLLNSNNTRYEGLQHQQKQHVAGGVRSSTSTDHHEMAALAASSSIQHLKDLQAAVDDLDAKVRQIKSTGVFLEVDENGKAATAKLQEATRKLLKARYGPVDPYRVKLDLIFQPSNPTFATQGKTASVLFELAPMSLQPHSIFTFLEVARRWHVKKGAFHRRANHVLQAVVNDHASIKHLAFQEYSPSFPHVRGTVGYAGRPSGPAFYVSIMDNSKNHGPGSQGVKNPHEADSCFGKVLYNGLEDVMVGRVAKMPGMGFLPKEKHVLIDQMTILVPDGDDYKEWSDIEGIYKKST